MSSHYRIRALRAAKVDEIIQRHILVCATDLVGILAAGHRISMSTTGLRCPGCYRRDDISSTATNLAPCRCGSMPWIATLRATEVWIVSPWLADQLTQQGATVSRAGGVFFWSQFSGVFVADDERLLAIADLELAT